MVNREILLPIARTQSRATNGIGLTLPFYGVDIWTAWELTWLGRGNRPEVATASFYVPADSAYLIESKSLKLYLNSFAMTTFPNRAAVQSAIKTDLDACVEDDVEIVITHAAGRENCAPITLSGTCLDSLDVQCDVWEIDAALLAADDADIVTESLHTHLLRSLCPVTGQPDMGSLQVTYQGPRIDAASLLRYVVSFREHNDFHEACVERMYVDIKEKCGATNLSVYARYQRRGGIDINPFRSNFEPRPDNNRLWRQ
jgi:7-cyano-7-deazaguanine reductase